MLNTLLEINLTLGTGMKTVESLGKLFFAIYGRIEL